MSEPVLALSGSFLVFDLGGTDERGAMGSYGVDVTEAGNVIEPVRIAPVPLAPSFVRGILSHHGRIVTVVDPAPVLGLPAQELAHGNVLVLRVAGLGSHVGLLVRRVRRVVVAAENAVLDLPRGHCVRAVARLGPYVAQVLDVSQLLSTVAESFDGTAQAVPQGVMV